MQLEEKNKLLVCHPVKPTDSNFESNLESDVASLLPYCNLHCCTPSCFKYGDHDICRHDYPRKIVEKTQLDGDELMIKRLSPWINNYEAVTLTCMRCNHDTNFVASGKDSNAAAFYMTDYQTKSGKYKVFIQFSNAYMRHCFPSNKL